MYEVRYRISITKFGVEEVKRFSEFYQTKKAAFKAASMLEDPQGVARVTVTDVIEVTPKAERVPNYAKIEELADAAGVSVSTVYRRAQELGRLPTVEECVNRRGKSGGKTRYL